MKKRKKEELVKRKRLCEEIQVFSKELERRRPLINALPDQRKKDIETIGRCLETMRLKKGLSRLSLADKTNSDSAWISLVEEGFLLPEEITEERFSRFNILSPNFSKVIQLFK